MRQLIKHLYGKLINTGIILMLTSAFMQGYMHKAAAETTTRYRPDQLYNALSDVETKGLQGPQKFIRTKIAPKAGSAAYGPIQAGKMLLDYGPKGIPGKYLKDPQQRGMIKLLLEQRKRFLKYGREPNKPGYDPKYDYGGAGDIKTQAQRDLYKNTMMSILQHRYQNAGYDMGKFLRAHRGLNSPKYNAEVMKALSRYK